MAIRERDVATGVSQYRYQHTDALGSPVVVTDQGRNVIERSEYEPYGRLLNRPLADGPGFTGHVGDAATGLSYMQQRYYDPTIGRFLSVDPVTANPKNGSNFNRYWYANDNPYKFIDPDGRYTCKGSDQDCKKVDQLVGKIREAKSNSSLKPAEVRQVQKVLTYLGQKGKGGPTITPTSLEGKKMASTDQRGNIKVDLNKTMPGFDPTTAGATSLSHEADHDIYAKENGEAHTREAATASEKSAYGVEAVVAKGLGISISQAQIDAGVKGSVEAEFGPEPDGEKK